MSALGLFVKSKISVFLIYLISIYCYNFFITALKEMDILFLIVMKGPLYEKIKLH